MSCNDYSSYAEFWTNFQPMDGVICPFADLLGMSVFALFAVGAVGTAFYVYTDSISLPAVLVIIIGSVVLVELPAGAINLTVLAILGAVSAAVYLFYQRIQDER